MIPDFLSRHFSTCLLLSRSCTPAALHQKHLLPHAVLLEPFLIWQYSVQVVLQSQGITKIALLSDICALAVVRLAASTLATPWLIFADHGGCCGSRSSWLCQFWRASKTAIAYTYESLGGKKFLLAGDDAAVAVEAAVGGRARVTSKIFHRKLLGGRNQISQKDASNFQAEISAALYGRADKVLGLAKSLVCCLAKWYVAPLCNGDWRWLSRCFVAHWHSK
jgi:hypothetical protein